MNVDRLSQVNHREIDRLSQIGPCSTLLISEFQLYPNPPFPPHPVQPLDLSTAFPPKPVS